MYFIVFRGVNSGQMRSVDAEALARLARLLDAIGDDIAGVAGRARALVDGLLAVPAIGRLGEVVAWAHQAASVARRTALLALSDGRDWRQHHSLIGRIGDLADAQFHGLQQGTASILRGGAAMASLVLEPVEVANAGLTRGTAGLGDELERGLRRRQELLAGMVGSVESTTRAVIVEPVMYPLHVFRDGFWRSTDELAQGLAAQVPGLVLAAVTDGACESTAVTRSAAQAARGAAGDLYLGVGDFDPAYADPGDGRPIAPEDAQVLGLSVPVAGSPDHVVGLDFRTGDFMVAKLGDEGFSVTEKRWSRLSDEERGAMRDGGLVDRHGRLGSEGATAG
ncbi:MAG: hypothetical protein QOG64_1484 [Acidimicrobiaceae bacterium]|nr:hypothetical protein [Acidimicrobiaceae bacterium]